MIETICAEVKEGASENGGRLLLFLDYDGTLVPLEERPELATPPTHLLEQLRRLCERENIDVVVISGRMIEEVERMLPVEGLTLAGTHGVQIRYSDGESFAWGGAAAVRPTLDCIRDELGAIEGVEGVLVERKASSIALHYRLVDRSMVEEVKGAFRELVQEIDLGGMLEVIQGAEVLEARARGWNKGHAVEHILERLGGYPAYLGDDTTDEDAFAFLSGMGTTVLVSDPRRETSARYHLKDPTEVWKLLLSIEKIFQ